MSFKSFADKLRNKLLLLGLREIVVTPFNINFYTWLQRAGMCYLMNEPDLGKQNDEEYREFKEKHNFDKLKKETKVKYKLKDMEDDFK